MFPQGSNGRPASRSSKRSLGRNDVDDDPIEQGRDEDARRAADAIQTQRDDLGQPSNAGSVLFPSDSASNVGVQRSSSYTSLPSAARAQRALQETSKPTYGSENVDSEVAMVDSRPTTPRGIMKQARPTRSMTSDSFALSDADTAAAGYLVRDNDDDRPLSDITSSPPLVKRSVKRGTPGLRDDGSRVQSVHGVLDDPVYPRTGSVMFPGVNGDSNANGREDEKPPHPDELSENEAWYFLRTLVGHELQWEQKQLHKLGSLEIANDDFSGPDGNGETTPLDPQKVPILRYLIKHFILTLPIVREMNSKADEPVYWTEGLYPLLQKWHAADFSQPVDQGQKSLLSRAFDEYALDALERFVSAGLKLASRKPHKSQEDPNAAGPLGKLEFESGSLSKMGLSFTDAAESPVVGRTNGTFAANGHSKESLARDEELGTPRPDIDDGSDAATETNVRRRDDDEDSDRPPRPMSRQTGTTALTGDAQSFVSAPEGASTIGDGDERDMRRSSSGDWMAWVTGSKPSENADDTEKLEDGRAADEDVTEQVRAATPTATVGANGSQSAGYEVPDQTAAARQDATETLEGTPRPKSRSGSRPRSRSSHYSQPENQDSERYDRETTPTAAAPAAASPAKGIHIPADRNQNALSASQTTQKKKRASMLFGFLKKKRNSNMSLGEQSQTQTTAPTSRQVPQEKRDSVQAMAVPISAEDSRTAGSVPVGLVVVPKSGLPWPFGAPVAFWRGTPFQRLRWGGFETDVVGVRSSLFGKSFIIRVRRPQRLDEYVVRTEDQFRKFFRNMDKMFPDAHIRQVPSGAVKGDETIQPPQDGRPLSVMSPSESRFSMLDARSRRGQSVALTETTEKRGSASRSKLSAALVAASEPVATPAPQRKRATSLFSRGFRSSSATSIAKQSEAGTPTAEPPSAAGSAVNLPTYLSGPIDVKKLPHDPQRRALRNWLRDTLSIRTVGHHRETAAFLLLGSFVPKESDLKDIRQREFIDDARRHARVEVASGSAARVQAVKEARDEVERECIAGDGFATISDMIRKVPRIKGLPDRYLKTIEWCRLQLAEVIFENFVNGPGANVAYGKLKAMHQAFPYFLVRQAFRLPNPNTMAKVLQDILLARPFGSKSLLQKVLAIVLDDDPTKLLQEIQSYRTKIGSPAMTEKLDMFVYADRKTKDSIRRYARDQNIELVLCILRGAEEPRLPAIDLQRAIRAGKMYRNYVKKNAAAGGKLVAEDPGARLVIDLQMYLRLVSKDRDANMLRELLADESTADALEVVMEPIVQFIKRTYKTGNGAQAITDLEKFFDQLIIIVEALRARVQEPQKGVRILARLLARHEESLYRFIRDVHTKETIIEEFLQWGWTLSAFLQRGMSQMIDLDQLLPTDSEDRAYLFDEVEAITECHRKKRAREYQNMSRRYAGDVDADDPVSVEGDGRAASYLCCLMAQFDDGDDARNKTIDAPLWTPIPMPA